MVRGEVVRVELPWPATGEGREQTGERPALVVQSDDALLPTTLVIPFTTKSGALRFPYTIRVEPSKANGLTHPSVLLVFQMRAIDTKRIVARLGRIEDKVMRETEEAMAKLLAIT